MTDRDDAARQGHQEKADEVERELDEMEQRSGNLEGEIGETREDWESKKRDASVPGAGAAPGERSDGGTDPDDEPDAAKFTNEGEESEPPDEGDGGSQDDGDDSDEGDGPDDRGEDDDADAEGHSDEDGAGE